MTDIYTVFYELLHITREILAIFVLILCFIKRGNSFRYHTEILTSTFCFLIIIISIILNDLCGIIGITDNLYHISCLASVGILQFFNIYNSTEAKKKQKEN